LSEQSRACRPIVTTGGRSGTRVDVGSWAALALGVDGGQGSSWLCKPLAQRPSAFASDLRAARAVNLRADASSESRGESDGESEGQSKSETDAAADAGGREAASRSDGISASALAPLAVRVAVEASFPDEDIARLHASVRVKTGGGHSLAPEAEALVTSTVTSLLELLRSLGGEASAAAVALEVTCTLEPSR